MGAKLQEHAANKAKKVNGWDILSVGFGLGATLLVIVVFMQPKNPVNRVRLPAALCLFAASVTAERCRESDLLSLDRALDYQKNIQTDQIRLDTVMHQTLHEIKQAEVFYEQIPIDRHQEVAARIGIAPPNYAARQVDPVLSQVQTVAVSAPIDAQIPDEDPAADYDPEEQRESSGSLFIPANKVQEWFDSLGENIPESLIDEWNSQPGIGIEVHDGSAHVVHGGRDA